MKEYNIYIAALEIGVSTMTGISFEEMCQSLRQKGYKIEKEFEYFFMAWFFTAFFVDGIHGSMVSQNQFGGLLQNADAMKTFRVRKGIISGEAYFQYLDYVELKETRKMSRDSSSLATISIWIAIFVGIGEIIVGLCKH
jgi:hypothetical protein